MNDPETERIEYTLSFTFDGERIPATPGQTIGAALAARSILALRTSKSGDARGMHCAMGTCFDCLVAVNGETNVRACMRPVRDGDVVGSGGFRNAAPRPAAGPATTAPAPSPIEPTRTPDVLIVGGGPAGLSAALAAAGAGARVVLLDERARLGGQYFKQPAGTQAPVDRQQADGHRLIDAVRASGVEIHAGAAVWGTFENLTLAAHIGDRSILFAPKRLVIATGAYERGVPVPGWTLPGYMTTGGVQTLLRSHRIAAGRRVLVSGNGPLNLQLAAELTRAGVEVTALVETGRPARAASVPALLGAVASAPGLFRDAWRYWRIVKHAGVPILTGRAITEVTSADPGLRARVSELDDDGRALPGRDRWFDTDVVAVSYGFSPSNEIARAIGCEHRPDEHGIGLRTVRDDELHTSVGGVYVAGDCAGLGGARGAIEEGAIAGEAAARSAAGTRATSALAGRQRRLARHRRFQRALWRIYRAPALLAQHCTDDTIVCRCEEVTLARVKALVAAGCDAGSVKRQCRAGMGRCQGRYCGVFIAHLLAAAGGTPLGEYSGWAPRPPFKPIPVGAIALDDDGED